MKRVTTPTPLTPRRVGVAEAKSKLSEVLRDAAKGPTIIHNRGRDLAVLLALEDYEALLGEHGTAGAVATLLERLDRVKKRHGGGVDDFEPALAEIRPADPFARRRDTRRSKA